MCLYLIFRFKNTQRSYPIEIGTIPLCTQSVNNFNPLPTAPEINQYQVPLNQIVTLPPIGFVGVPCFMGAPSNTFNSIPHQSNEIRKLIIRKFKINQ